MATHNSKHTRHMLGRRLWLQQETNTAGQVPCGPTGVSCRGRGLDAQRDTTHPGVQLPQQGRNTTYSGHTDQRRPSITPHTLLGQDHVHIPSSRRLSFATTRIAVKHLAQGISHCRDLAKPTCYPLPRPHPHTTHQLHLHPTRSSHPPCLSTILPVSAGTVKRQDCTLVHADTAICSTPGENANFFCLAPAPAAHIPFSTQAGRRASGNTKQQCTHSGAAGTAQSTGIPVRFTVPCSWAGS
jgi:hypothetical protein